MSKCLVCNKNESEQHPRFGVIPCKSCREKTQRAIGKIKQPPEFATGSQTDRIQMDRLKEEGALLQPRDIMGRPNKDFVDHYKEKAYPYFSKEELEKL